MFNHVIDKKIAFYIILFLNYAYICRPNTEKSKYYEYIFIFCPFI